MRTTSRNKSRRVAIVPTLLLFSLLLSFHLMAIPTAQALSDDDTANGKMQNFQTNNHQFQILAEKRNQLFAFTNQNIIQPVQQQYSTLSPKGKFFSTAFAGFTTSRITVGATIKVAKYAGAAFIISEVLNSAGILDNDNEDCPDMIQQVKSAITTQVNNCRLVIRKHCDVAKMKSQFESCLENDRVGTLGFASGAVAALIL